MAPLTQVYGGRHWSSTVFGSETVVLVVLGPVHMRREGGVVKEGEGGTRLLFQNLELLVNLTRLSAACPRPSPKLEDATTVEAAIAQTLRQDGQPPARTLQCLDETGSGVQLVPPGPMYRWSC